jgi:hypothetical protein
MNIVEKFEILGNFKIEGDIYPEIVNLRHEYKNVKTHENSYFKKLAHVNQHDIDSLFNELFQTGYIENYNNIYYDFKKKQFYIYTVIGYNENRYVLLNVDTFIKRFFSGSFLLISRYIYESNDDELKSFNRVIEFIKNDEKTFTKTFNNFKKWIFRINKCKILLLSHINYSPDSLLPDNICFANRIISQNGCFGPFGKTKGFRFD